MTQRPNIEDYISEKTEMTKEIYHFINVLNDYIDELENQIMKIKQQKENQKNYIALFRIVYAIGQEEWEVETKTKLCNRNTTIGEIVDWYKSKIITRDKFHCEIVEAE